MKHKLLLFLAGTCLFFNVLNAQNLIQNGDFEQGSGVPGATMDLQFINVTGWSNGCGWNQGNIGTPDLCEATGWQSFPDCNLYPRPNSGANNRTVHLIGNPTYPAQYGESVKGTITTPLTTANTYVVSCFAARQSVEVIGSTTLYWPIEFVLRKNDDCSIEKVVYTTGNVPVNNTWGVNGSNWSLMSGSFTLSQADVNVGYNRLEIRIKGAGSVFNCIYIDDVALVALNAAFSFVTPGQTLTTTPTPWGPTEVAQVCAAPTGETAILINGSVSTNEDRYRIVVTEWDPYNWVPLGPAVAQGWILTQVPATDINISNLTGVTILPNKTYLVGLEVGLVGTEVGSGWHSVNKLFRVNPLPTINAGADQSVCSGTAAPITVTTSNWPVKVYRGSSLIGTYSSNPINLTPTATTTYTFTTTNASGCSASDAVVVTVTNCSTASFFFEQPCGGITTVPSPYGAQDVTTITLQHPYIDGTASSYETGYYLDINAFNSTSSVWSYGANLYSGWYGTGQITGPINLLDVIHSVNASATFVPGQLYMMDLSVGPRWNSMKKLFRVLPACTKMEEVEMPAEGDDLSLFVSVFPNPTDGEFTISFTGIEAQKVIVYDMLGNVVFEQVVTDGASAVSADLTHLKAGVYTTQIVSGTTTILKKLVKN